MRYTSKYGAVDALDNRIVEGPATGRALFVHSDVRSQSHYTVEDVGQLDDPKSEFALTRGTA